MVITVGATAGPAVAARLLSMAGAREDDPARGRTGPEPHRPPTDPHHHPQTLHTEEIQ